VSVTALAAIAQRDFSLSRSYRLAFAFDLMWGAVDIVLYYFISRVVGAPTADLGGAPTYFAFAVAGIVGSLVVGSATAEIASRIREEQLTGTLEIVCAQPLASFELACGYAVFPVLFALARAVAYLAVAVAVLDLGQTGTNWLGVAIVLMTGGLAFVGVGILAAAATVVFKRGEAVAGFLVFAMGFVSGALFPITVLPGWLEPIGKAMPMRFAFEGLRHALYGGTGWGLDAIVLAVVAVIGIPLASVVFALSLRSARRAGTLAQY
jgi:ABC-2 type transport system permease protein